MMVTILIFSILNVLALALIAFDSIRVRNVYETTYEMILADRNAARKEAETLKAALFPQLARVAGAAQPSGQRPAQGSAAAVPAFVDPRKPFRLRFKQLVKQHNTQQIGRDRMAAAISEKPDA